MLLANQANSMVPWGPREEHRLRARCIIRAGQARRAEGKIKLNRRERKHTSLLVRFFHSPPEVMTTFDVLL